MRIALHPKENRDITVEEYIKEFGHKPLNLNYDNRPRAKCKFCQRELIIRAESSTKSTEHFAHLSDGRVCPAKEMHRNLYRRYQPATPDREHARILKQQFLEHWKHHYAFMRGLTKNLSPWEFEQILQEATRLHIWEYAGLLEYEIPYVLCTLHDFPPQPLHKEGTNERFRRRCWFRFWFDTTATDFNELWINGERPCRYWVAYYDLQKNKKRPGMEDLKNAYSIEINDNFLHTSVELNDKLVYLVEPLVEKYIVP